jgi:hypothetical protein
MESSSGPGDNGLSVISHLLKESNTKSDTEKFVAMSVLQSVLDSEPKLREDRVAMASIWHLMPHPFLARLLRSRASSKVDAGDSQNMNSLAIGILHTFTNLLAQDDLNTTRGKKYVMPLIEVIPIISNPQRPLAYHALQCLVSTSLGADAFLQSLTAITGLEQLIQEDDSNMESIVKTLRACRSASNLSTTQKQQWDDIITTLVTGIQSKPELMLDMLTEHITQFPVWRIFSNAHSAHFKLTFNPDRDGAAAGMVTQHSRYHEAMHHKESQPNYTQIVRHVYRCVAAAQPSNMRHTRFIIPASICN